MKEALLYDRQEGDTVLCHVCPWVCEIPAGENGRCQVRQNREGTLFTLDYGLISAAAVEPIERRGLYHLFPGSVILALGGWGNNLLCRHRPSPAVLPEQEGAQRYLDPERAVTFALDHNCRGMAWGYQEPMVWLEYVLDAAMLARANGLFTILMTNGFATKEAFDLLGPYIDACVVEILGAVEPVYESLCEQSVLEPILEMAAYAKERWRCHIELRTPIISGVTTGDGVVRELADWIRDSLGPGTPWHLWGFEPAAGVADFSPTSREELERAQELGQEAGLHYVYIQAGEQVGLTPTLCPSCGRVLIQRKGEFYVKVVGVDEGRCSGCEHEVNLRRTIFK
jgi:pyruvate formate lyase activating enzyme